MANSHGRKNFFGKRRGHFRQHTAVRRNGSSFPVRRGRGNNFLRGARTPSFRGRGGSGRSNGSLFSNNGTNGIDVDARGRLRYNANQTPETEYGTNSPPATMNVENLAHGLAEDRHREDIAERSRLNTLYYNLSLIHISEPTRPN